MTEATLDALINLFAVFSIKGENNYEIARKNLKEYLTNQLGIKNPNEYLDLFFEIFDLYSSGVHRLDDDNTKIIVGKISNQIKGRIHHSEQLMIFLHFLELAKNDLNSIDHSLYDQVANIFGIKTTDYLAFKQLIFANSSEQVETFGFLLINNKAAAPRRNIFHIRKEHFKGDLLIYYVAEIEQFIFKYFGSDSLFLEGSRITPNQFYIFNQGAVIRGGINTNIYFTEVAASFFKFQSRDPLTLTARDITFSFPGSSNGIRRFSFSESSGQLIAVMGGSGVGKSTLLNVLNGNLPLHSGTISINGTDIHDDYDKIEGLIGFVPQDDLVFEELTVFQNIYYNALLCLDNVPAPLLTEQIDRLLKDLNLFEIKDLVVGNPLKKVLSGGQRKRLNIALELIREPSILFVDEPTSGLSSRDSEKIILLLKQQAQQGKLVIVNIHQPSSFVYRLFDKLWIFDNGGYPVYAGNPLDAIVYFKQLDKHIDAENFECRICGNVNPDQVLDIIETQKFDESGRLTSERKFSPEELNLLYVQNIQDKIDFIIPQNQEIPEINFFKPNRLKQFKIFFSRNLRAKISNLQYIFINLLQAPILALIVSFLTRYSSESGYYFGLNKNFPTFLFMAIIVMLFQGMSLSATEIIKDRKILQREAFLRLSRSSYLNSKISFLLIISLVQSFLFVAISSRILGMEGLFFKYWLILFLTAVSANLTGLNISSGLNSVVTIYITIPLLIIPQILLCGLIVRFDDLKGKNSNNNYVPVIGELMISRWSFEALAVEQYMHNKYNKNYYDIEQEMSEYFIDGELIIPKLSNAIISLAINHHSDIETTSEIKTLKTIVNEINNLDRKQTAPQLMNFDLLSVRSLNRSVADKAIQHLEYLRDKYKSKYQDAERRKDSITSGLVAKLGREGLINLKKMHNNSALAIILTNQNADNAIRQGGDRYLVKVAPVFRAPDSKIGRAQFYAPYKMIGNMRIATYNFNLIVIILICLFLYVTLYFDWLKKLIYKAGNLTRKFR